MVKHIQTVRRQIVGLVLKGLIGELVKSIVFLILRIPNNSPSMYIFIEKLINSWALKIINEGFLAGEGTCNIRNVTFSTVSNS